MINKSSGEEKLYAALNRVPIIFAEDKDVIVAYDKLFESSRMGDNVKMNESLIIFLKVICKSLKINCSDWNDSKVLNVFGKWKGNMRIQEVWFEKIAESDENENFIFKGEFLLASAIGIK